MNVYVEECPSYDLELIEEIIRKWEDVFRKIISPGDRVVLKPNWIAGSHKYNQDEWQSIITHPSIITATLKVVLDCLEGNGKVVITDGPQTDSSWDFIMSRMTPELWVSMGKAKNIDVAIIDLRLDEWTTENEVTIGRHELPGDPLGSTICDLNQYSEFIGHRKSSHGYYGADYDIKETNEAHHDSTHKYKVSRSAIEANVFINIPKLKTHKKAGITCSLKNLVGINTYKNWLPHHNVGTPDENGDQSPYSDVRARSETFLVGKFKNFLNKFPSMGKIMIPAKKLGKLIFGDTQETIRSGNWYGNDTLWRMVLDLNKVLFYSNSNGSLKPDRLGSRKEYLTIIDGVIGGEGQGPDAADPVHSNVIVMSENPISADVFCAKWMGFDWRKIPSLRNAFKIEHYRICDFQYEDINVVTSSKTTTQPITRYTCTHSTRFEPHFGWKGHIEINTTDNNAS